MLDQEVARAVFVAPRSLAWVEVWRVDVGPIWHASFSGIPFVHTQPVAGVRVPEWHPWPGEEVGVDLVRPDGVAGQTLTIDESTNEVQPGLRATDATLTLHVRSSRGGQHTITLPPDAQLESLSINGATQPIRQQGSARRHPGRSGRADDRPSHGARRRDSRPSSACRRSISALPA